MTNATFYDYRESDTVQAIQIDVGKLNTWLTNNAATNILIGSLPQIGPPTSSSAAPTGAAINTTR